MIWGASAMLGIVLPSGISAAIAPTASWLLRRAIAATNVVTISPATRQLRRAIPPYVRVPVEIVVVVVGNVVVAAQPQPHPHPPLQNAPIITPTPNEIATPAA
jgi:Na+-translocating ferredoxin:NAD+ oxidoreductase RnfE subunit